MYEELIKSAENYSQGDKKVAAVVETKFLGNFFANSNKLSREFIIGNRINEFQSDHWTFSKHEKIRTLDISEIRRQRTVRFSLYRCVQRELYLKDGVLVLIYVFY